MCEGCHKNRNFMIRSWPSLICKTVPKAYVDGGPASLLKTRETYNIYSIVRDLGGIKDNERRATVVSHALHKATYVTPMCCMIQYCMKCYVMYDKKHKCEQIHYLLGECPHCHVMCAKAEGCNAVKCVNCAKKFYMN